MPRHPGSTRLSAGPSPMTESIEAVVHARVPLPSPLPPLFLVCMCRCVQMCAAWAVERGGEGSRHGKSRGVRHRAALAQARGTTNTRHRRTRSRRRRRRSIDGDIYHRVLTSSLTRWVDPLLRCSRWRCSWLSTFLTLARPWAATLRRDSSRPRGRSFLYAGAMQSSRSGRVTLEVINASHGLPQV